MTRIHAVIYSRGSHAWISVSDWQAGPQSGIIRLSREVEEAPEELRDLAEYARDNLSDTLAEHAIRPNADGLRFESQVPRLLLFRHRGENWVARGFRPWGSAGDAEGVVRLRIIASPGENENKDVHDWARAAAGLLHLMREGAGASQQALDLVPAVQLAGSIAFPTSENVRREVRPGAAEDFGNAEDSDV